MSNPRQGHASAARLWLGAALCAGVFACAPRSAPDNAVSDAARAAVEQTLTRFSTALAAGDTAALRALTAPSFALVDEGMAYDYDGMVSSGLAALATGTMTRRPEAFRTEVRGDVAWTHYRVRGEFDGPKGRVPLALLETAVLERIGNDWRVALVSTLPEAVD